MVVNSRKDLSKLNRNTSELKIGRVLVIINRECLILFICGLQVKTIITWPLRKIVTLWQPGLKAYQDMIVWKLNRGHVIVLYFCLSLC